MKLLIPEGVQIVASIHEHKGKQGQFLEANMDELKTLLEVATIQSPGVSNRIEGIFIGEKRLEKQLDKNDKNYVYILSFMRYWGRVLLKGVDILNKYYG